MLPDPTADWETYTNTKYGFSIKYPPDEGRLISFTCEEGKEYAQGDYTFEFTQLFDLFGLEKPETQVVYCGPGGSPYTIEVRAYRGEPIKSNELEGSEGVESQKEEVLIDKVEGIKATFNKTSSSPLPEEWIEALVFKDGNRYHFFLSDLAYEQTFNLILSTFKFLEEDSAYTCIERDSLNCTDIPGLTFECTWEYQEWAEENCLSWQEGAFCTESDTGDSMTLTEAKEIALASDCIEQGSLKSTSFCNEDTGTWWIDLDIEKEGCAPACVIDVSTKEAEINWRCTGLISD